MTERKSCIQVEADLSVRSQCNLLGVNRSMLYYASRERLGDIALLNLIRDIWLAHPFYGYRKIEVILRRDHEMIVNHKRVQRLMQLGGIQAIYPHKNLSKNRLKAALRPYLLKDLVIDRPNQVWMIDITYLKLNNRCVYLVALMDVFSRYIVGWQLSYDLDTDHSLEALKLGLIIAKPEIINADQGGQYTSDLWLDTLTSLNILISHDGAGRWADNIYIERFWRSIKYEAFFLNEFDDFRELYLGARQYVQFYNHQRPHQALNSHTPHEIFTQDAGQHLYLVIRPKKRIKT